MAAQKGCGAFPSMIILCSKSAAAADSIAQHLIHCTTRGPFVVYCSSDIRAAKLATRLAKETAIDINALLRWGCLLCLSVGCFLSFTVRDKAALTEPLLTTEQIGTSSFYSGVALGVALIAIDGYKNKKAEMH